MEKGLLLIPATNNGATLKNVLAVVFNKVSRDKNKIPKIGKVTFLENRALTKIRIEGEPELLNPADAYDLLFEKLGLQSIEIRRIMVDDYASQVPEIVMSAVKEVGANNIAIDLTNGLRDITGSLYSAAILCKITNLLYIEVKKYTNDENRTLFYDLGLEDKDINDKYTLKKFKSIKEIEALASLNCMELIMFREGVEALETNNHSMKVKLVCNNLHTAITDYFRGDPTYYAQSMRCVGVLNEELVGNLAEYMDSHYCIPEIAASNKGPRERIELYKKRNYNLSKKESNASITEDERQLHIEMSRVFKELPGLLYMIRSIQELRNVAAHNSDISNKENAKIMLMLFLRIISGLDKVGILNDVYPDPNNTNPEEDT